MDWIHLAQELSSVAVLVEALINLGTAQKTRDSVTCRQTYLTRHTTSRTGTRNVLEQDHITRQDIYRHCSGRRQSVITFYNILYTFKC